MSDFSVEFISYLDSLSSIVMGISLKNLKAMGVQ